jgi:hypothetical protein
LGRSYSVPDDIDEEELMGGKLRNCLSSWDVCWTSIWTLTNCMGVGFCCFLMKYVCYFTCFES